MCRAEAHQLYTRKPIFDAMGIQLVVLLTEHIDGEVRAFWLRYWGGMVVNYLTGFFLNPVAIANYKRSSSTGFDWNVRGKGNIKGDLYVIRAGSGGVAYQFVERNFGDWAPLDEVMEACENIMQKK
uniref:Peroxiredoxin-like 2A n=1 Tax=Physcomitrium patens TaxID=3218 RepID=A0A7I4B1B2_PHYPA